MIRGWLTYGLVFFLAQSAWSQQLLSKTDRSSFKIGEPVTLTYTVKAQKGDSLMFRPEQGTIEARSLEENSTLSSEGVEFEIVDAFVDTFIFKGDQKTWVGQYTVTAWDSGMFIIPGAEILINDSTFRFKDISVECLLVDAKKDIDLYDVEEYFADIPDKPFSLTEFLSKHWWWMTLIVLAIIVFFIIRKRLRKEEEEEPERPISLKERTLLAIDALDKERMWEEGRLKEHFVELSYILRSYLTSRYNFSLLEHTTYQSKLLLKEKGLNEDTIDVIVRILSQSDMVKFAKSKPDAVAILRQSTLARQIVAETSPLDFDNVD